MRLNVLMKSGGVQRLDADDAQDLVDRGQARFVNNTVARAIRLGIKVEDPSTRDEDGRLRSAIRAVRKQREQPKKQQEAEAAKERRAKREAEADAEGEDEE